MKSVTILIPFLVLGFYHEAFAQKSSIKAVVEFPLQFGVGYEYRVVKRFSVGASVGVLTPPNSTIIIAYLKLIGTDETLVLIIEDAFQLGIVGKLYANYNFGRNYFGTFVQAVGAQAGDASAALIEDYFDTSIQDYPLLAGKTNISEKNLTVRTRLYQAGLLYGHRFPLKNNRFEIDAEIGLSANIGSLTSVSSETRDLTALSSRVDAELSDYYRKYAYIPSMGVMLVYKLNKKAKK